MKVAVLGGGLIGLSSAHALLKDGHEVVIVESDTIGGGATPGNAGWVCQSQVGPLAAPGMLRQSIGMLLKPTSPLYIAPRLSSELMRFMLAFPRQCTKRAHSDAVQTLVSLAASVQDDYAQLEDELETPVAHDHDGILICFLDAHHAHAAHASWNDVARVAGSAPGPLLDAAAIHDLEPSLADGVSGGFLLPQDSHLNPAQLAAALRDAVEKAGAQILEGAGDCALLRRGSRVRGLLSATHGEIGADEVVLAAGARSAGYFRELGIKVPMVAGTGYSFTVTPEIQPRRPLMFEEAHVVGTPMNGALRIAGTMEISGRTSGIDQRRVNAIVGAGGRYLKGIDWAARTDVWGGNRPVTSDGLPVLGRPDGIEGCVVATGHGMYGVTLAPTTGRIVADVVKAGAASTGSAALAAVSPSRR